jgi:hypothetical protein
VSKKETEICGDFVTHISVQLVDNNPVYGWSKFKLTVKVKQFYYRLGETQRIPGG